MSIPFVDVPAQNKEAAGLRAEVVGELYEADYILGEAVRAFEEEYARFISESTPPECIGTGSGTEALEIALRACGIGSGDLVAVPALTFVATAEAVARVGAVPIFTDVDQRGHLLLQDLIQVADDVDAVIPVHLYGAAHPNMAAIQRVAAWNDLVLIEDAAQAHGAVYDNAQRRVGDSASDAITFSFYPSKNLGAAGDAGALVTGRPGVAERARKIRNHGGKNEHDMLGLNGRMDSIQAAVLRNKLEYLDEWNGRRYHAAVAYDEWLDPIFHRLPRDHRKVWHLYPIIVPEDRDAVKEEMRQRGISCGTHYPYVLPDLGAFSEYRDLQTLDHERDMRGDIESLVKLAGVDPEAPWPRARMYAEAELSLPMHPHLGYDDIRRAVEALEEVAT